MDSGANQGSEVGLERLVAMVIRLADGYLFAKRLAPIPFGEAPGTHPHPPHTHPHPPGHLAMKSTSRYRPLSFC